MKTNEINKLANWVFEKIKSEDPDFETKWPRMIIDDKQYYLEGFFKDDIRHYNVWEDIDEVARFDQFSNIKEVKKELKKALG